MKQMRTVALAVMSVALFTLFPRTARTDPWNKKTFVTFSEAVETPRGVLPPGKYVFKLVDSLSDRHIVQILNEREDHVEATILAFSKYRLEPADKSIFMFYELPAGQPHALHAWFYPGDTIGQEFAYPKERLAAILAAVRSRGRSTVMTAEAAPPPPAASTETSTSEATTTVAQAPVESPANTDASSGSAPAEPVELAQNRPAEQPREQSPEPTAPATMPQTASEWPLVAMLGAFSLGAAILLRTLVRFSA